MKIFIYSTITNLAETKCSFDDFKCVFHFGTNRRLAIVNILNP
jgi:hypothetical protein